MSDTRWPAGHPDEVAIRAKIDHQLEMIPCAATISRGDLAQLDNIISFLDAIADFTDPSMYDDAWNLRNHLVPFVEGDDHFDAEASDA